jgi:Arc/MetJ-type ribon-helix-helix transcriptional regulator
MPNGKSRMISIRISDEDYREIKSRCGERGAANVSEFVRAAAMQALGLPEMSSFPAFLRLQVSALERRLDRLDEQVSTLADRMSIASQQ